MSNRQQEARDRRIAAAETAFAGGTAEHYSNGEGEDFPFLLNFSKGMPHGEDGIVRFDAYLAVLRALSTRNWADFEAIPVGMKQDSRRFVNPQAGLAYDTGGPDPQSVSLRRPPLRVDSPECSAEMAELYWMAQVRDVRFDQYGDDDVIRQAADDLSSMSDFRGPKERGLVTPQTLFRGGTPGDVKGPYVSQFLLRDVPFGTLVMPQRQHKTVRPGREYVTDWNTWLRVQNGQRQAAPEYTDGEQRYITTARDLAHYVHYDMLHQAYLNATQILLDMNAILDFSMPYVDFSKNQDGFGTYGGPHIQTLVAEVALRALRAVWFTKWFVHRRMRPEEFGGRVHAHQTGLREFPMIDKEIQDSPALAASYERHKSYLLPQAYPEGAPTHPSYGAGHAAVAGACVTALKAWFCESFELPDPVVPDETGTRLVPYDGPPLFTGGELNKLAMNIGTGRNMAGIHWRTDYTESIRLGEAVAIRFMREHLANTHEHTRLTLTTFDGSAIDI